MTFERTLVEGPVIAGLRLAKLPRFLPNHLQPARLSAAAGFSVSAAEIQCLRILPRHPSGLRSGQARPGATGAGFFACRAF